MGVPSRIMVDCSSEFITLQTLEGQLRVKVSFIPPGKHQQNLVESAHKMPWSTLCTIRVISEITIWKAAVQEAVHQYNENTQLDWLRT